MSVTMDDPIKRRTAKRKTALVVEIIEGTCEGPWRQWRRVSPEDGAPRQPARHPRAVREAAEGPLRKPMARRCWSCGREKSSRPCWMRRTTNDPEHPAGPSGGWHQCAADQALRLVRRAAADCVLQADQGRAQGGSTLRGAHQDLDRKGAVLRLPHRGLASGLQQ